jgi:cell division transport system permease protein
MRLSLWPYFIKKAFTNILNNRMVHVVGISTMLVSLLILGTFLFLFVNLDSWVQGLGQSLSMSVYLKEGISEAQKDEIAASIRSLPSAEIERFVSKNEALRDFRKALGPEAGLLEGLSDNPLPPSFEVVFRNPMKGNVDPQKVKEKLEKISGVEDVQYSEEWLRRFEGLMNVVRIVGFIVGGLLCLGVLFIVTNTVRLAIYARREEIEILKLVGATDWFVKVPFLLEGLIQGAVSGLLALAILFGGYAVLSTKKMAFLGLAVLHFSFLPHEYVIGILALSVVLGLMGSFIAIGRFFNV